MFNNSVCGIWTTGIVLNLQAGWNLPAGIFEQKCLHLLYKRTLKESWDFCAKQMATLSAVQIVERKQRMLQNYKPFYINMYGSVGLKLSFLVYLKCTEAKKCPATKLPTWQKSS